MEIETSRSKNSWFSYIAELLTAFFAITVLAGRIYAQSYWNVFGLPVEIANTSILDYAIISPNTTVASILIALGVILFISFFGKQNPDFVERSNSIIIYNIGYFIFFIGLALMAISLNFDTSSWTPGTGGLTFGMGYLSFITGIHIWLQAGLKSERTGKSRWEEALFRWINKFPLILLRILLIAIFIAVSLWGIVSTAQKFGSNEAKEMILNRPNATIILDSIKGFEDLIPNSNMSNLPEINVRIITEAGGLMYVCPGGSLNPPQLYIRAIPVTRIQDIQYAVGVSPIGK